MTPLETKLIAALDAHMALRVQAEELIAAYVAPDSHRAPLIDALITLFDGPQQREAQRLADEAWLAGPEDSEATLTYAYGAPSRESCLTGGTEG